MIFLIICAILLVFLSSIFSGIETAYMKMNLIRLNREAENGNKKALKVKKINDQYGEFLSTILVGNNLTNIAASSIATVIFVHYFNESLGSTIATIVTTLAILIFGEIIPKAFCSKYAYGIATKSTPIVRFFEILFFPFSFVLNKLIEFVNKIFRAKNKDAINEEELENMAEVLESSGEIDEETLDLLVEAIYFKNTEAYEIMTNSMDVFGYDLEDDINILLNDERIYKYSYIPVYQSDLDHEVGVVKTNDLIKAIFGHKKIDIEKYILPPFRTIKTKSISDLIHDLKSHHTPIAFVKGEFSETLGIVTMEDILEELVGEIYDETDEAEEIIEEINEDTSIVDGDLNINDFLEYLELSDDDFESHYDTVGGFCTENIDDFPKVGDNFDALGYHFEIVSMVDDIRVDKVRVTKLEENDENED